MRGPIFEFVLSTADEMVVGPGGAHVGTEAIESEGGFSGGTRRVRRAEGTDTKLEHLK